MFDICTKIKQNGKNQKNKVKSIENEKIIVAIPMTKTIITKIIIIIMMRMRIKIGNRIKI